MKKIIIVFAMLVSSTQLTRGQGTLLVANKNEHTVSIVNLNSGATVAKISVGQGPHEVAVSPSGKMAAVANYGNRQVVGSSLSVIDIAKKEKIKDISLGEYRRPHGIEFITEDEVLVTSEANQALLRVNISSGEVSEVVKTTQQTSHMVAWSGTDHKAYVANINPGTVTMVDVPSKKLLRQIEFKKGIEGIAVSPDGKEVWVANREDSTVTAVSTSTFEKLGTMPAHQVAYRIKFTADGKWVVVSNGMSGNLSVYDAKKKKMLVDVNLQRADFTPEGNNPNMAVPVGIATSTDSKWIFVSTSGYRQVAMISTKDWKIAKRLDVGDGPDGVYYSKISVQ